MTAFLAISVLVLAALAAAAMGFAYGFRKGAEAAARLYVKSQGEVLKAHEESAARDRENLLAAARRDRENAVAAVEKLKALEGPKDPWNGVSLN